MYRTIPKRFESTLRNLNVVACREVWFEGGTKAVQCYLPKVKRRVITFKDQAPNLYNQLLQYDKAKNLVSRTDKYMFVYRVYEVLEKNKKNEYVSIRHAIAHDSTQLTRPKTIKTIERLFGTLDIDLDKKRHGDVFYDYFIKLLVDVDKLLYKILKPL